ncbi:MAG TPA: YeiH family protein [Stellaceae bacterium]|nr:YeiH family protein [Stellaceae bacterium]
MTHTTADARFGLAPGIAFSAAIAALAFALRALPGMSVPSPMIIAVLLGILCHNIFGTPTALRGGINFSARQILRFAVATLGLQLTVAQVAEIGGGGIVLVVTVLSANFLVTKWLGRLLHIDAKLAELVAAGSSICGASAVVATNAVTGGSDEDAAYAVACVTIFGSIAMFVFPLIGAALDLAPRVYGLWAGSSIHEIAQVVAAAFQRGPEAGHLATVTKLLRVVMLGPLVIALGLVRRRGAASGTPRAPLVPWFVTAFIALVAVATAFPIPHLAMKWIALATTFLLSMALAGLGLETDLRKLLAKGLTPLLLGAASALFIASLSLALIAGLGLS